MKAIRSRSTILLGLLICSFGAACEAPPGVGPGLADSIQVAWRQPLRASTVPSPALHRMATDGQRLYVLWRGITAFDLTTGVELWQTPVAEQSSRSIVVRDGRVFESAVVARALDAATGAELWRFRPDTVALAETAVDERAFYIATASRRVYALDVATGTPLWSVKAIDDGPFGARGVDFVTSGDTVYAALVEELNLSGGLKRGWMVALDRRTGRVLWRYANERTGEAHDVGGAAVAGRMLLANDLNGGAMLGIDRLTGTEVWRRVGPADRFGAWDTFKVVDGIAYLASKDTHAYALDPQTGKPFWVSSLGASASSSAVCGDFVFISSGGLLKLRRSDGREVASLFLNRDRNVENEWVSTHLLSYGGRVYFAANTAVYAVECR